MLEERGRRTQRDPAPAPATRTRPGWPARVRLLLPVAVAAQLGCYTYLPSDVAAVPVGAHVRASVSAAATDQLRTYGVEGPVLDGRLVAREGDVLTLFVPSVPLGSPLGTHTLYQQVPVAEADVLGVNVRTLDVFRTAAAAAVGAAAVTVVAVRAFNGGTGGTGSGTGGGPTESVRPWWFKITIPLP